MAALGDVVGGLAPPASAPGGVAAPGRRGQMPDCARRGDSRGPTPAPADNWRWPPVCGRLTGVPPPKRRLRPDQTATDLSRSENRQLILQSPLCVGRPPPSLSGALPSVDSSLPTAGTAQRPNPSG